MAELPTVDDWALLGLEPGASEAQVRKAYERKRVLYDANSLATYSLFAEEERQDHLQRLEAAFRRLTSQPSALRVAHPAGPGVPPEPSGEPEPILSPGALLRHQRLARGTTVADVSARTKIRPVLIEALEAEDYPALPAAVYVRGFVMQVARLLDLAEPDTLASNYLARMARHQKSGGRAAS